MVTEDELNRVLLTENEKNSFAKDGVSMQDLAEVALRIEGVHVERQHAEGSTGGGFSADEFRKVVMFTPGSLACCASQHPAELPPARVLRARARTRTSSQVQPTLRPTQLRSPTSVHQVTRSLRACVTTGNHLVHVGGRGRGIRGAQGDDPQLQPAFLGPNRVGALLASCSMACRRRHGSGARHSAL